MTELDEQDLPEQPDVPLAPDEQEAAEAEEAEQAEAELEEQAEGEQERDEPPTGQSVTPEQHDLRVKKLNKSFDNYGKRLEELFAADANDYLRCPLCLGETPGFLHKEQAGRIPDDQAVLVKHVLGLARPIDYPASSQHRRCAECQGLGKVSTGSEVPGKETIMCGVCSGNGFVGPKPNVPTVAANGSEGVTGPTVYTEPVASGDFDKWEQPRLLPNGHENPNYGRTPEYWIRVEPWGDTRGLTAQDAVGRS